MLILDKPKPFDGQNLRIPLYHRGHLSLLSGTKVWLCLLPGGNALTQLPELIISPINFAAWSDLWRIEVTMNEAVGIVHKLLNTLHRRDVNVLAEESSSIEKQKYHTMELIVDASRYSGPMDGDTRQRSQGLVQSLPDLKRELLAEIIQHISLWPSGEPRLKISRMKGLYEATQAYQLAHLSSIQSRGYSPVIEHTHAHVEDTRGWIELPSDVEHMLQELLWTKGLPPRKALRNHPSYLLLSDTKNRYLRAYFIRPTDAILTATIEHEEKIGALAAITESLRESRFNILTSLSRLHAHGGRAQYELVLQPPAQLIDADEDHIREAFEQSLSTRDLIRDYKPAVSYKNSYKSPTDFRPLTKSRHAHKAEALSQRPPTEELLERQYSALSVQARAMNASDYDIKRFSLVRSLLDEERRARKTYIPRRILFISYAFASSPASISRIVSEAKKLRFEVTTGKNLKRDIVHRDGIMRLISESTDFLGIWSREGAYRFGRKVLPSPWLHWELGVAAAKGLKPRILISTDVHPDAWKVYPEVPHKIFEPTMFLDSLRETLKIMASDQIYP